MRNPFRRKGRKKPMMALKAGAIGLVLLAIFLYLGFTKFANPLSNPYTVHAIVPNAGGLVVPILISKLPAGKHC